VRGFKNWKLFKFPRKLNKNNSWNLKNQINSKEKTKRHGFDHQTDDPEIFDEWIQKRNLLGIIMHDPFHQTMGSEGSESG